MARGREKGLLDGSDHMAGGRGVSDGEGRAAVIFGPDCRVYSGEDGRDSKR